MEAESLFEKQTITHIAEPREHNYSETHAPPDLSLSLPLSVSIANFVCEFRTYRTLLLRYNISVDTVIPRERELNTPQKNTRLLEITDNTPLLSRSLSYSWLAGNVETIIRPITQ